MNSLYFWFTASSSDGMYNIENVEERGQSHMYIIPIFPFLISLLPFFIEVGAVLRWFMVCLCFWKHPMNQPIVVQEKPGIWVQGKAFIQYTTAASYF